MPKVKSPSIWTRWDSLICLGLLGVTAAAFWQVRHHEFIVYDDPDYVTENQRVQAGLTAQNVAWAFQTASVSNWHPLTWLSHMLDCQLFGLNPGAHHLVNVGFHVLNSLLLFVVFRRMTGARWRSAFVAALFAVHPLHVESAAWVAERKDVLSAFFWMLALWAYVKWAGGSNQYSVISNQSGFSNQSGSAEAPREGGNQPSVWYYWLAVGFFALGLMAKPMVVTLPFVLLLLDFWPLGRFRGESDPDRSLRSDEGGTRPKAQIRLLTSSATVRGLILEKVPFFVLTVLSSIVTYLAQLRGEAMVTVAAAPIAQRLGNAAISYVRYIGKTIWPENLAVFYPFVRAWPAWEVAGAALFLAGVTVLVYRARRSRGYLAVGWWWYVGTLVPVIGLVQVGAQSMADRYSYIPLIGLFVMMAWGAVDLIERWQWSRTVLTCSGLTAVAGCVVLSLFQVALWKNSVRLLEHSLAVTPDNAVVRINLGSVLLDLDRIDEAVVHFQKGLQMHPENPQLNNDLGTALDKQGKFAEAVRFYSTALRLKPDYMKAHLNLGNALVALGKVDEAVPHYAEAARLAPAFAPARWSLGDGLLRQGKLDEAGSSFLEALRLQPDAVEAHSGLAQVLAQQGRNREALAHLTRAIQLNPGNADLHLQLGSLFDAEKRVSEALAEYREAVHLQSNSVAALNNLAYVLATAEDGNLRNGAEAVKYAERACELTGRHHAVLMGTLAAAYAEAGRFPEAIRTAQQAVETASAAGEKEVAAANLKLLDLYRAGKPYRDTAKPRGGGSP